MTRQTSRSTRTDTLFPYTTLLRSCLLAQPEHFRVPRAQLPHLFLRDGSVVQRFAPVRAALEHGQVLCGLGDLRDRLHTRRARPDHSDPLALECHLVLRPEPGVIGLASIAIPPLDVRERGRSEERRVRNACASLCRLRWSP